MSNRKMVKSTRWLIFVPAQTVTNAPNSVKKILSEIHALTWTLAGTGMVLITLSGQTKTLGWGITFIAILIHLLGVYFKENDE
jgi:hypothetical protein